MEPTENRDGPFDVDDWPLRPGASRPAAHSISASKKMALPPSPVEEPFGKNLNGLNCLTVGHIDGFVDRFLAGHVFGSFLAARQVQGSRITAGFHDALLDLFGDIGIFD